MCAIRDLSDKVASSDPWPGFWLTVLATLIGAAMAWVFSLHLARRAEAKHSAERAEEYATAMRRQWAKLGGSLGRLAVASSGVLTARASEMPPEVKAQQELTALTALTNAFDLVQEQLGEASAIAKPKEGVVVLELSQLFADGNEDTPRRNTQLHLAGAVAQALAAGQLIPLKAFEVVRHLRQASDLPEWGDVAEAVSWLDRFIPGLAAMSADEAAAPHPNNSKTAPKATSKKHRKRRHR